MNHARLYDIMSGAEHSLSASAARLGLGVLALGYRLVISLRNMSFDLGLRKPATLPCPVISVGNLTTGGTGKTPMVIELAKRLIERGSHPAVLLRGYRAQGDPGGGDEAMMLAGELGSSVPVQPNPNRATAADRVIEKHPTTSVFLLDDGFQHRQVHRDLDIVLIDATRPFGFDRLLPRGLMREPEGNLSRADSVILTRCDLVDDRALADLDCRVEGLIGRPPDAHTAYRWSGFRSGDRVVSEDYLLSLKTVGVSAVGNPAAFERTLEAACGQVLACHNYDDHHSYTLDQVCGLLSDAKDRAAQAVVVTEKDWVKWKPLLSGLNANEDPTPPVLPVIRPILGVEFLDGSDAVDRLLEQAVLPRK